MEVDKSRQSPNYTAGRRCEVDTIVIHHTGGNSTETTLRWFEMRQSQVSAHYVIGRDGKIFQMVSEDDTAWHCGKSRLPFSSEDEIGGTVNHRSIGIELVNCGDGKTPFPEEQMDSLVDLVNDICRRKSVDKRHILGHKEIAAGRKDDPADNFDWSRIR